MAPAPFAGAAGLGGLLGALGANVSYSDWTANATYTGASEALALVR